MANSSSLASFTTPFPAFVSLEQAIYRTGPLKHKTRSPHSPQHTREHPGPGLPWLLTNSLPWGSRCPQASKVFCFFFENGPEATSNVSILPSSNRLLPPGSAPSCSQGQMWFCQEACLTAIQPTAFCYRPCISFRELLYLPQGYSHDGCDRPSNVSPYPSPKTHPPQGNAFSFAFVF